MEKEMIDKHKENRAGRRQDETVRKEGYWVDLLKKVRIKKEGNIMGIGLLRKVRMENEKMDKQRDQNRWEAR